MTVKNDRGKLKHKGNDKDNDKNENENCTEQLRLK